MGEEARGDMHSRFVDRRETRPEGGASILVLLLLSTVLWSGFGCDATDEDPYGDFERRWQEASAVPRPDAETNAVREAIDGAFPVHEGWSREVELRWEPNGDALARVATRDLGTSLFRSLGVERAAEGIRVLELAPVGIACVPVSGASLFVSWGCSECHPAGEGSERGPGLRGLLGRERRLTDGSMVVADEAYFRSVLTTRGRATLAGWAPLMPTYADRPSSEVDALVHHLSTLE